MTNTRETTTREMTFEEEAKFYEKEARAEFAKETGGGDCSAVNSILRRGMRIISKARQEIANGVTVQELALPEQDYYVLRNTETGMYFRGKGVNRWGKHFNQTTIYRVKGTAEHSIKEVAWHGEKAELVRIKIVEMPQPPKGD